MSANTLMNTATEVRENLVTTAVNFLKNPNVNKCTMESKERFLRAKGLTDIEITKAVEKCGELLEPSVTSELMFFQHSTRSWFRDHVVPLLVYGGFAYGCYWMYKNCIRHLLFVEEPKRKTTAEVLDEVRKSLDILNTSVTSLRGETQASAQSSLRTQLDGLKADIASVKGILLNSPDSSAAATQSRRRASSGELGVGSLSPSHFFMHEQSENQFPSIKMSSEPPSIPAWQRQSEEATSTELVEIKKPHRNRSQRSESSSEGEHATKNSDSSLEIIQ